MNNLEIKAEIKGLKKTLCDDDFFYQVPNYQRPYAWDKDNLSDLVDDLFNAYQNNTEESYFCGSLVLVKDSERYDIIDGQQRLTTFIILSCVLRDFYSCYLNVPAKDWVNSAIQQYRYKTECKKLTLLTDENYQNIFQQTVLEAKIRLFEEGRQNIENKYPDNKYLQNAHHLKNFISEKLENNEGIEINEFVEWIFEKVVLTTIICPNQDTAIQIFNVLNDRGMPLSSVDILKSSLMHKLKNEEDRNSFKTDWDNINRDLKEQSLSIEGLFNIYLYYTITSNPKTTLHKELLQEFKDRNSLKLIHELSKFKNAYIKILNAEDRYIYCLKYLKHSVYWQSILTTAKCENYQDIDLLKQVLVAYYYQNWIAGATTARIKQTSFNILKLVKENKSIQEVKAQIQGNLNKFDTTRLFEGELNSPQVKDWAKPLLLLLEYFSKDKGKQPFIPFSRETEIEHILPQNPETTTWINFTEEQKKQWTNALANLTPLSWIKNRQAKNYSFAKKKKVYMQADGVAASWELTRQVFEYDEWNVESLEDRRSKLIKKIKELLDIF